LSTQPRTSTPSASRRRPGDLLLPGGTGTLVCRRKDEGWTAPSHLSDRRPARHRRKRASHPMARIFFCAGWECRRSGRSTGDRAGNGWGAPRALHRHVPHSHRTGALYYTEITGPARLRVIVRRLPSGTGRRAQVIRAASTRRTLIASFHHARREPAAVRHLPQPVRACMLLPRAENPGRHHPLADYLGIPPWEGLLSPTEYLFFSCWRHVLGGRRVPAELGAGEGTEAAEPRGLKSYSVPAFATSATSRENSSFRGRSPIDASCNVKTPAPDNEPDHLTWPNIHRRNRSPHPPDPTTKHPSRAVSTRLLGEPSGFDQRVHSLGLGCSRSTGSRAWRR